MTRQQEKLLVAALCGMVIVAASALVVQPVMATGHQGKGVTLIEGAGHLAPAFSMVATATSPVQ